MPATPAVWQQSRVSWKVPSGLALCGELEWGAHICHFYETRADLVDTLVPFFAAGLAHHERCLWVTADPLPARDAHDALSEQVPDLDRLVASGQIRIVDHSAWHTRTGRLDAEALLEVWIAAEREALAAGYTGLRATGNVSFLASQEPWHELEAYEARVSDTFAGHRIIGLCSYPLGETLGKDVLRVIRNHQCALARHGGAWELVENAEIELAKEQLRRANEELERRVHERTTELRDALDRLAAENADAHLLRDLSATLVADDDVATLYRKLIDAAATVMHSDFASMQAFHPERGPGGALELIAHRGFPPEAAEHWAWVSPKSSCVCGRALEAHARVVVADVEQCDYVAGTADLATFRSSGIRAVQSTPLWSRSGALVGMLSTHWNRPYEPDERDLRLFDILVRQAADLIERTAAMEALHARTAELVEADRRKDEFLATLAHELRNPLAPIRTGLAVLQTRNADAIERVVPIMERQVGHMVRLIDDLLDVSRVSRGKVTLRRERVAMRSVIESAIETNRPAIDAGHHAFEVTMPDTPLWIDGDATRLAQVVSNVLDNAAKYTPDGGAIRLFVEDIGDEVAVRICDSGIGIAPEMLPRVFELFAQAEHSLDRARGGLGIGLALARMLVELHGGRITAESEGPGRGSMFTIWLPLRDTAPGPATLEPAARAAGAGLRILVVDDNVDGARTLAMLLEAAGHTTELVFESPTALDAALRFRPDLVFLDIGMPGLSGHDVARLLRGRSELAHAVIVALTGWGSAEDRARSRAAGCDYHLTKPVLPDALADVIARARRAG